LTNNRNSSTIVAKKRGDEVASVSLNFKVPEELRDKVVKEADKKNISMASMIRVILSEYFEEEEK